MNQVGTVSEQIVLARAIADARRKAGLTQQELCAKANLSYSTLAKIERGAIKTPSVFTVAAIAAATGSSVEALTGISLAPPVPVEPPKDYKTSKNGVKFVYFDINGVIVRFYQRAFTKIALDTGASADSIEATFWHYNDAVCRGEMSLSEFDSILAKRIGVSTVSWEDYYLSSIETIPETVECLKWVADNYRVGLMSNIAGGLISKMITQNILPNISYNSIVDSSVVGSIKPEQGIYEQAAKLADFTPNEILLIDDSRTNLMAAEKLGWHVIWFDDYRPEESQQRVRSALEFS